MSKELFSTTKPRENWDKYFKKNNGLIIDLGCGYGADSYFLAKKGYKVIAIDKDKNIKFDHPNLSFIQQELEIPINEKFDGVIANFSLQFLPPETRFAFRHISFISLLSQYVKFFYDRKNNVTFLAWVLPSS